MTSSQQNHISNISPEKLRELLQKQKKAQTQSVAINKTVSEAEERMWFLNQINPNSNEYSIQFKLSINSKINASKFKESIKHLYTIYPILRSNYKIINNKLARIIPSTLEISYTEIEVTDDTVEQKIFNYSKIPFKLDSEPLLRVYCFFEAKKTTIFFNIHHIICDGWSIGLLLKEIEQTYNRFEPSNITREKYQLFINWEINFINTKKDIMSKFWSKELENQSNTMSKFSNKNEVDKLSAFKSSIVTSKEKNKIEFFCKKHKITPFMFYIGTIFISLLKLTKKSNITIGVPLANRIDSKFKNTVGLFVNTVPFNFSYKNDLSTTEFFNLIRTKTLLIYDHHSYPLNKVISNTHIERTHKESQLFNILFTYQNEEIPNIMFDNVQSEASKLFINDCMMDLSIECHEKDSHIDIFSHHKTNKFSDKENTLLLDYIKTTTKTLLSEKQSQLINLIKENHEEERLYNIFSYTKKEFSKKLPLHQKIMTFEKTQPEKTAIQIENKTITYSQLCTSIKALHTELSKHNLKENDIVSIYLSRNEFLPISIFSILNSNAGFLTIDPKEPEKKVHLLLNECQSKVLITESKYVAKLNLNSKKNLKVIVIDKEWPTITKASISKIENTTKNLNQLAYVIFTSGTTGKPKGIKVSHKNIINYLESVTNNYYFSELSTLKEHHFACFGNFSYDLALTSLLAPFYSGSTCYLYEKDDILLNLKSSLESKIITTIKCTPSQLKIINSLNIKTKITKKLFIIGGEKLESKEIKNTISLYGKHHHFINEYGPAETTIGSTAHLIKQDDLTNSTIPIGKPISNTNILILNKNNIPLSEGVIGEIAISGNGVSLGYLNYEETTFTTIPINNKPIHFYKTGDYGFINENNNLEYIERLDTQVKLNGFRIELTEIEIIIKQLTIIKDCVAVIATNDNRKELIIFYQINPDQSNNKEFKKIIIDHIKQFLPNHLLPNNYVQINSLPLTENGKINKKALLKLKLDQSDKDNIKNELTNTEKSILKIWQSFLNKNNINITEDFFELGGNSLTLILIQNKIFDDLNIKLSYSSLLENRTIKRMATFIEHNKNKKPELAPPINLLKEKEFDIDIESIKLLPKYDKKVNHILITGATGFVGIYVLKELLSKTNATMYVISREKSKKEALNKLKYYFKKYSLDQNINYNKIIPVLGNLNAKNIGINELVYSELLESIDIIFHCAAHMDHFANYEQLKDSNVGSIKELINFATKKKLKKICYISTASIFKSKNNKAYNENEDITKHSHTINEGYSGSKWIAENILLDTLKHDLPFKIIRLGLITGDNKTGTMPENQWFPKLIETCINIQTYSNELKVTIAPVDFVASAIVKIGITDKLKENIFHLSNNELTKLSLIFEHTKIKNNVIPIDKWLKICKENNNQISPVNPFINELFFDKNTNIEKTISKVNSEMTLLDSTKTLSILENKFKLKFPNLTLYYEKYSKVFQKNIKLKTSL